MPGISLLTNDRKCQEKNYYHVNPPIYLVKPIKFWLEVEIWNWRLKVHCTFNSNLVLNCWKWLTNLSNWVHFMNVRRLEKNENINAVPSHHFNYFCSTNQNLVFSPAKYTPKPVKNITIERQYLQNGKITAVLAWEPSEG